jgi:hypothetical protein
MSDYYPAEIRIGGPIPQIILTELIRAIVNEGVSLDGYGGPDVTEEALWQAFRQGAIVALYADQARYGEFDLLEAFLGKHRIHFDRFSEAFCEYNAEAVRYRGGKETVVLPADQNGNVLLCREEIAAVLEDASLDAPAQVEAIRRLVNPPETEPLAPIRFI